MASAPMLHRLLLLCALAVGLAGQARADCFRSAFSTPWVVPATWEINSNPGCIGGGGTWVASTTTYPGDAGRTNDIVEIVDGDAITYNDASVTIALLWVTDGSVTFDNGASRALTVTNDVAISASGTVAVPSSGGAAVHTLSIGGSLDNDGTFDMRGGATQTCEVSFVQDGSPTISGAGTTTFDRIVVNLGGAGGALANTLDVTAVITTAATGANIVAINNGTFQISSASTVTAAGAFDYVLDNNAGLTIANAGATVSFGAGLESEGAITVSAGVLDIGGAFEQSNSTDDVEALAISGGTVRVATAGADGDASTPTFWIKTGTDFSMSDGALVVENGNPSTSVNSRAVNSSTASGRLSLTGGTITLGSGAGTAGTFRLNVSNGSLRTLVLDTDGIEVRSMNDLDLTGDLVQTSGSLVMDTAAELLTTADPADLGAPTTSQTIEDAGAGWAMLAPPRSGMTVADLMAQNVTSGFPGSHYPGAGLNLLTGWDGSAWGAPTGETDALTPGEGFIWYFFHDQSPVAENVPLPFTLDATCGGVTCSGTVADPVVSLNAMNEFALLGNPFGHAITITDLVGTGADIPNVGTIWNDGAGSPTAGDAGSTTGSYVLTTTNADRVAIWQGVFLDNPNGATAVTLPDLAKTDAATTFRFEAPRRLLQLTLAGYDAATETRTWDEAAVLYFASDATDGWDAWDAPKLTPLTGSFATLAFMGRRGGEERLKSQESRPLALDGALDLPVAFTRQDMGGSFEIRWPGLVGLPEAWALSLLDTETGTEVDLRAQEAYTFAPTKAGRSAPSGIAPGPQQLDADDPPRFVLRVTPAGVAAGEGPTEAAPMLALEPAFPNPFRDGTTLRYRVGQAGPVRLAVYDVLGREVAEVVDADRTAGSHTAPWDAAGIASGVYVVRLEAGGRVVSQTVTRQR